MRLLILAAALLCAVPAAHAQTDVRTDTIRAGRYDSGKMWTFEYAPKKYFSDTYAFNADDRWFERARLGALRIPGCSAAFVSATGLVVTNHHCARGRILQVSRPGEKLDDTGFYAATNADERPIAGFTADQLIAIHDVSDEVFAASDRAASEAARPAAREAAMRTIRNRLEEQHAKDGTGIFIQIVPLYAGGRYSAYVFRRYTDVRLVAAPELQLGFFGGDSDNFTYPRYALDFTFLRVYGPDGKPVASPDHYRWSRKGVQENDVVFVIGNPGPTTRMNAVAQLEFIRDIQLPATLNVQRTRYAAYESIYNANPDAPNAPAIRNQMFTLANRLKAGDGRIAALHDPVIMAKRRDAERQFAEAVNANATLKQKYGTVLTRLADVQQRKRQFATPYTATLMFGDAASTPALLRRAALAYELVRATEAGVTADSIASIRTRILRIGNNDAAVERALLAAQYAQWRGFLTDLDTALVTTSVFTDSARAAAVIQGPALTLDDPALRLITRLTAQTASFGPAWQELIAEETELNALLGRARFEIYGTEIPPDASSSPRITDGRVLPFEYNGTIAPVYTTFFGMYDRNRSFGQDGEWALPPRWVTVPAGLELGTPLNFVSTADTYGGNSGSPAVTKDLELVGLNFDRNINGLSRDYVYLPEKGRNVMVDVRAIAEALRSVLRADRLLAELDLL